LRYRPHRLCAAREAVVPAASIIPGDAPRKSAIIHSLDGAKSKGPSMSIKFEGKPPFYLGIAEIASLTRDEVQWVAKVPVLLRRATGRAPPKSDPL
jgi:hypothetical protein